MPAMLTKEELLFLKRGEILSAFFDKIGAAKKLIAEAQVEMRGIARAFKEPTKAPGKPRKAGKARSGAKAKPVEFGVDVPDALSMTERAVYAELQKAGTEGRKPRELMTALKMSLAQVGRATRLLKKRKLITSTGATLSLTWKVR